VEEKRRKNPVVPFFSVLSEKSGCGTKEYRGRKSTERNTGTSYWVLLMASGCAKSAARALEEENPRECKLVDHPEWVLGQVSPYEGREERTRQRRRVKILTVELG